MRSLVVTITLGNIEEGIDVTLNPGDYDAGEALHALPELLARVAEEVRSGGAQVRRKGDDQ